MPEVSHKYVREFDVNQSVVYETTSVTWSSLIMCTRRRSQVRLLATPRDLLAFSSPRNYSVKGYLGLRVFKPRSCSGTLRRCESRSGYESLDRSPRFLVSFSLSLSFSLSRYRSRFLFRAPSRTTIRFARDTKGVSGGRGEMRRANEG